MKAPSLLLPIVCIASLSACVVENSPPPAQPPPPPATAPQPGGAAPAPAQPAAAAPAPAQPVYVETAAPAEQPAEQPKSVAEGRPPHMHNAAPEAYWVWHDGGGWHVRTTTARYTHRFQGRVWGVKGAVENLRATRLEWNDRLRKSGNAMSFDFTTTGATDGFDFQIAEGDCAQFYLLIDGKISPDRIFIGQSERHPTTTVFRLCQ